jgi:aldose 1-epimerase
MRKYVGCMGLMLCLLMFTGCPPRTDGDKENPDLTVTTGTGIDSGGSSLTDINSIGISGEVTEDVTVILEAPIVNTPVEEPAVTREEPQEGVKPVEETPKEEPQPAEEEPAVTRETPQEEIKPVEETPKEESQPAPPYFAIRVPLVEETPKEESQPAEEAPVEEVKPAEPVQEQTNNEVQTMGITKEKFGEMPDNGGEVDIYTLTNAKGASIKVLNLGGIIFQLNVPDKDGKIGNISANLETVADYLERSPNFGTLVGRYGNRIADAKYSIDGTEIDQTAHANDNGNLLHGGKNGFHKSLWTVKELKGDDFVGLELTLVSDENHQGFPGTVTCVAVYKFNNSNELEIDYTATTDQATPINLTQHTYFNLSAFTTPTVLDEVIEINADQFIPVNEKRIPTGEIVSVEGTPMDFRTPKAIGERIEQVSGDPKGYDHCYVLNQKNPEELTFCAKVSDPVTGRTLEVWTTKPGVQFYTGNFLDGTLKAFGLTYNKNAAFCLETQYFPDSPNQPAFPNTILKPGETYKHTAVFKFGVNQ